MLTDAVLKSTLAPALKVLLVNGIQLPLPSNSLYGVTAGLDISGTR